MINTNLETTLIKVESLIGTVSIGVSAFERENAFTCISPADVAGMLENIRNDLGIISQEIEREIKTGGIEA